MPAAVLVVIPTFNEAGTIGELLTSVRAHLRGAHVLVVDDASPDGTAAIVKALAVNQDCVHLLERPSKLGLGAAYVDGFRWGLERGYQRFFEMDADFSHDPAALPGFVAALDAGADVVVGSRGVAGGGVEGWGPFRHVLSKGGSLYARVVLGIGLRDWTTGFKAYSRRALELIDLSTLRSNGYAFQIETSYRAVCQQLRVVEIPIVFVDRRVGKSKMTSREVWDAVVGVWLMRRSSLRKKP